VCEEKIHNSFPHTTAEATMISKATDVIEVQWRLWDFMWIKMLGVDIILMQKCRCEVEQAVHLWLNLNFFFICQSNLQLIIKMLPNQ
jgi:hypothetical protein